MPVSKTKDKNQKIIFCLIIYLCVNSSLYIPPPCHPSFLSLFDFLVLLIIIYLLQHNKGNGWVINSLLLFLLSFSSSTIYFILLFWVLLYYLLEIYETIGIHKLKPLYLRTLIRRNFFSIVMR